MKCLKVTAACLNQTPLDWDGNFNRITTAITEAREQGTQILCLPELVSSGYGCEDRFLAPSTCARAEEMLCKLLPVAPEMVVAVGLPVLHHNAIFNTTALILAQ